MIDSTHELCSPRSPEEWSEFHRLRRKVLFENRGKDESYIENHPDDFKNDNHPLVLINEGTVIGVCRLDVIAAVGWLRRVAIREDLQRLGHGRVLLRLAEGFAIERGCNELRTNAAIESTGFYESCGYVRDSSQESPVNSVSMVKSLS